MRVSATSASRSLKHPLDASHLLCVERLSFCTAKAFPLIAFVGSFCLVLRTLFAQVFAFDGAPLIALHAQGHLQERSSCDCGGDEIGAGADGPECLSKPVAFLAQKVDGFSGLTQRRAGGAHLGFEQFYLGT
jgi:hypothetical protein